jgi:uncharacterized damage-inducible protein DinB
MKTLIEELLAAMEVSFRTGRSWHLSLLACVEGVSAAQAAWTPAHDRNSIWKIVEHVALWKEDMTNRLTGRLRRPASFDAGDWAAPPEPADEHWRAALRRLEEAHASMRQALARHDDEDLGVPAPGYDRPLIADVRGVIAHDSYHAGQICYVRALQGIPAR